LVSEIFVFVNRQNEIVKIISLFNRTDKMRPLGKVSKGATGYIIMGKYSPPRSYPIINDFVDLHLYYCILERKFKIKVTGSNTRDAVEISSLLDGQISCQNGSPMERLRDEKQTFPPDPFRLLWVEMLYSGG
jgi:hypothetical protein